MAVVELFFWSMAIGAGYSYVLYPFALWVLCGIHRTSGGSSAGTHLAEMKPAASFIITAHNEAARIREKLENSLAIDYPDLEIIVASDCSTDATDAIVREFGDRGIRLVRTTERLGKEHAQRTAIGVARGEILVFSDAGTRLECDAVRTMVSHFADPCVGAVSSVDRFAGEDGVLVGEGAYVKYEMLLRRLESQLGGLVGLSGSFFAARAAVCDDWDIESPSDFNTALNCAKHGLKAISASDVYGHYKDLKDPSKEHQRKVRTVIRGVTGLARHPESLSLKSGGLFAWQLFSHKVMRWLVPLFLFGLFVSSWALASDHGFYALALAGQCVFYGVALAAHVVHELQRFAVVRIVYFFCVANLAVAQAVMKYLLGTRVTTWLPSAR